MKIIYDGDKHRSLWGLAYQVGFGLVFAAISLRSGIGKEAGALSIAGAVLFGGFGLWLSWSALREHLTLPIDVRVLDNDAIQIRSRSGTPIVLVATQFKRIRYSYEGSDGTLNVNAGRYAWSLPVSEREADDFIDTLLALNPQIKVERKQT